jgi:hypothetical protein
MTFFDWAKIRTRAGVPAGPIQKKITAVVAACAVVFNPSHDFLSESLMAQA